MYENNNKLIENFMVQERCNNTESRKESKVFQAGIQVRAVRKWMAHYIVDPAESQLYQRALVGTVTYG